MELKHKILALTVLPLLLAIVAVGALVQYRAERLAEQQAALLEESLLASKRAELKHYVELALSSIEPLYANPRLPREQAQTQAKAILQGLSFGDDGYFFAYDTGGRNLVHPRQPELVGRNLWDLTDPQGRHVIRALLAAARDGDGYQRYGWEKPSTHQMTEKLGYVVLLPRWGWMLGTGIYLDDLDDARVRIEKAASNAISATMTIIVVIAGAAALIVAICGFALNLSTQRSAEVRMRALAHQVVLSQETERARVARELHDGVSQLLVSVKFIFESVQERVALLRGEAPAGLAEMTDKGAVVALGENVEGFCPARQLTKEDGTTPKVGDKLDFKVLEFSKATKRITLSHLRTYEEAKRAEIAAEKAEKRAAADATKSTVKKINASVEKTTLGDIAGLAALKSAMEAAAKKEEEGK